MRTVLAAVPVATALVAAACASGPSPEAEARGLSPSTTTTTEALAANVVLVKILNGSFQPAVLEIDLATTPLVRFENEDDVPYTITSRTSGDFESPELAPGDTWEFDFSTLEPAVHRFFITRGAQIIPGLVDTRPQQ